MVENVYRIVYQGWALDLSRENTSSVLHQRLCGVLEAGISIGDSSRCGGRREAWLQDVGAWRWKGGGRHNEAGERNQKKAETARAWRGEGAPWPSQKERMVSDWTIMDGLILISGRGRGGGGAQWIGRKGFLW